MPDPLDASPVDQTAALEAERLLAAAIHDLRAPLAVIQAFAGGLETAARRGEWERFTGDVARIDRSCQHMQRLLQDLGEYLRLGEVRYPSEPCNLGEVWESAWSFVSGEETRSKLMVEVPATWPTVLGHRTSLVRLFQNLLENALRHVDGVPDPYIIVTWETREAQVLVAITDNGSGIDPEKIPALFQPYHQLSGRAGSMGLGLAIAQRIARGHDGDLTLSSRGVGHGAIATVRLQRLRSLFIDQPCIDQ